MSDLLKLRSDGLEWRQVEGEIVALDVRTSQYLSVNETGAAVWTALAAGATRDDLVARLVEEFDIDAATAGEHLDAFIASLAEQDLLE